MTVAIVRTPATAPTPTLFASLQGTDCRVCSGRWCRRVISDGRLVDCLARRLGIERILWTRTPAPARANPQSLPGMRFDTHTHDMNSMQDNPARSPLSSVELCHGCSSPRSKGLHVSRARLVPWMHA